jgi:radical SAM protein (TIGR01212 family)
VEEIKLDQKYLPYSKYLKDKYGEKVYKIPVNIPVSCPNRDGNCGTGGCIFCGEVGAGFEALPNDMTVANQLRENIKKIAPKYKAKKFIAYFQNFTNTYMPIDFFEKYMREACIEDIVEICISSRPDCINDDYLDILKKIEEEKGVNITIELGLQTVNYHTLKKINRGHGLAEYIDAVLRIKKYGFAMCTHFIANLPWDNDEDLIEAAKIVSILGMDQVKLHSLFILRDTVMGDMYENNEFEICSLEEYVNRVVMFIRHTKEDIAFQRFVGRAPADRTLFCNWSTSWWKIKDMVDELMEQGGYKQGDLYNYVNGPALKKL